MTAFGPYKRSEVVDFTELKGNRLFVVSGTTGAGKTTIFDAICFALYGSASGEDRNDAKMLRSDFASDDTHTSVELEFELRARNFRILRQLGHIKQGNKSATGERYEFFEVIDGKEIPCVDRQIVSEINKKVEELIGLTQDQFNQIVMLPQGEFRKLLTSQTENKEEILRRIFKTEPYKRISERLKEKKSVTEEGFNQVSKKREDYIKSIASILPNREDSLLTETFSQESYNVNQVLSGLLSEVTFYDDKLVKDHQVYEHSYKLHDLKQAEFHLAKALNERFNVLSEKQGKLTHLTSQLPSIHELESKCEKSERASSIQIFEKQVEDWKVEENKKKENYRAAIHSEKEANEQLVQVTKRFEEEKNKKSERERVAHELNQLEQFYPMVVDLNNRRDALTGNKQKAEKLLKYLKACHDNLNDKLSEKQNLNEEIKQKETIINELPDKQQKLADMREQWKLFHDLIQLQENEKQLSSQVEKTKVEFEKSYHAYQEMERKWVNTQASYLATHLHDGESCPVCGSYDHPKKATHVDHLINKEVLETSKQDSNEKESRYRTAVAERNAVSSQVKTKQMEAAHYHIPLEQINQVYHQLLIDGKKLGEEVNLLKELRNELMKLKDKYNQLEKVCVELTAEKEKVEREYQEQNTVYETSKAVYEEKLRSIPEELRVLSELEKRIAITKKRRHDLEEAWDKIQQQQHVATENLSTAKLNVIHLQNQLEETSKRREEAEKQFTHALQEATFESFEEYTAAKIPKEELSKLKIEIREFHQSLSTLQTQVKELEEELREKQKVDLTEMEEMLTKLKKDYETAFEAYNQSKDYKQEAERLYEQINTTNKQVTNYEEELSIITDLYDVIRGQNSSKISFERYLQIEYLEQIIQAANERLKELSNGQFYLIRSDRQESRGRQSGLGLDVYDAYTGVTRDVKTLSGGEKFNASLCLALGMADVIQSFQGGVTIDTMFIDEGFGSLDEESLHKSIDTLIELQQSGRMIGVISHVQELKAAIPAILEVKKSKEGYSKTQFIIK